MKSERRASGLLLHVSSLPSQFGIGDLGPASHKFVERLAQAKQSYWSILPLTPTSAAGGNSPYQAGSAFAGNTLLISPESLVEDRLLPKRYAHLRLTFPAAKVDYTAVTVFKKDTVKKAWSTFTRQGARSNDFQDFCALNSKWLSDYALYKVLKEKSGKTWCYWPKSLRDREEQALNRKREQCRQLVEKEKFAQYIFFSQWRRLREHCRRLGVSVVGDIPFYVSYDSADAWSHSRIFKLDSHRRPIYVGGVPPDYFSKTGQLWGNPVYDWKQLSNTDFEWWIDRIEHNLMLFDFVRLDHFRGFVASWQVRSSAVDARKGKWVRGPARDFFKAVIKQCGKGRFIAEDLGNITEGVRRVMKSFGIPGMRVLLFAFDGSPDNPHLPHNHPVNSAVFTATHDTNTTKGWFNEEATSQQKEQLFKCVGRTISEREVSWELIKLASASKARLSILLVQDVLSLGSEARMNRPAKSKGNWEWRISKDQLNYQAFDRLADVTQEFKRA